MNISKTLLALLFVGGLTITLSACEDQGPLEEAGENIDESVEETGDAIEDKTDG
ncbi:hypothetical protein [Marinobacter sp. CHS3-4]|uniref:hypothetical protein n=1 Tax=Marinobacter sp. CHS3-4 TaxID=3045174 RepID=UPI0024B5A09E|nr:hypothetical protein [Marinobacter sp. CHS3-4]MDI9245372.1 hypothetical protein [Marinobacter sp. CHS3-4]